MLISLIDINSVSHSIKEAVRIWRNSEHVKKNMYTDHNITADEHNNWLNSLTKNDKTKVFVILCDDTPSGIVSLSNIDYHNKTASWAFYLSSEDFMGKGVGVVVEYKLIEYVFNDLKLEKLNCEVLATNIGVISLHKKFAFVEEGLIRKNIIKEGARVDVVLLGLLKDEWKLSKHNVQKIISRFGNI